MGEDVLYSGTVVGGDGGGDARRARHRHLVLRATSPETLATYRDLLVHLVRQITERARLPASRRCSTSTCRAIPASEVRGIQVTKLGSRFFSESLTRMKDPWGREIFWIGGGTITWTGTENSDHLAVAEGYVSVTPAPHGPHQLLAARDGQGMVAGGVGEGDSYGGYRSRLVETLQQKGIRDLAVLRAVGTVPRHLFVPESVRHRAYDDAALPIGGGQTISQPWVQARYLELLGLTGRERVLEVGAGSGYQTALLALPGRRGVRGRADPGARAGRARRARGRRASGT